MSITGAIKIINIFFSIITIVHKCGTGNLYCNRICNFFLESSQVKILLNFFFFLLNHNCYFRIVIKIFIDEKVGLLRKSIVNYNFTVFLFLYQSIL